MFVKAIGFHPHRAASRGVSGGDLSSSVPKENPARVWGPSRGKVSIGVTRLPESTGSFPYRKGERVSPAECAAVEPSPGQTPGLFCWRRLQAISPLASTAAAKSK